MGMILNMRIRLGRWSIVLDMPYIQSNASIDHECLNGIMDGTYDCEYCYPNCKKCGMNGADWENKCSRNHCDKYGNYKDWKRILRIYD